MENENHIKFISGIKEDIIKSRYQAARLVNKELILLYFQVGKKLSVKIKSEKWGAKVIQNISDDLQKELPGLRGFSKRNLAKMIQFHESYSFLPLMPSSTAQLDQGSSILMQKSTVQTKSSSNTMMPLSTAQLKTKLKSGKKGKSLTTQLSKEEIQEFTTLLVNLGFTHRILILNKCKVFEEKSFYIKKSIKNQWTVELLRHHIESDLYRNSGKIQSNFQIALPETTKQKAINVFRDEYLLDFINVREEDEERVLENEIVSNIKKFILSIGKDFTFIGNQHRIVVEEEEFFIDLLFFHRELQSLVAIDLKTGKFKPEYAGKMNFYLSALDDHVKLPHENPSIGIILCKTKKTTIVEYAFRDIKKPLGVATFKLSKKLPRKLTKHLPDPAALKKLLK